MSAAVLRLVETPAGSLPASVAAPLPPLAFRPPVRRPDPVVVPPGRARLFINSIAAQTLPTLLMLVVLIGVWQAACDRPGSTFPAPTRVWSESREVIMHPLKGVSFADGKLTVAEGADVGLLVHIGTSLRRVLIG